MSLITRQRLVEDIEDHCVLYLPLYEGAGTKAKDLSSLNLDGTVNGASWVNGPIWKGLSFNGTTDYARTGTLPVFQDAISISAWIYPTDLTYHQDIIDLPLAPCWLLSFTGGGNLGVTIDYNGAVAGGDTSTYFVVQANKWQHVCGIIYRNGADAELQIYGNGIFISDYTSVGGALTPLSVNASYVDLSPSTLLPTWGRFKGYISEVRIYDIALSADEVFREYYRGARQNY